MDALEKELLDMITEVCRVVDYDPGAVSPDAPLLGQESPLGIDSLDAVEIVFTVQRRYNVRMDSEETSREALQSLKTLADFIRRNR